MPELPEVQTVVNQLAAKLKGRIFESALVKAERMASKNFSRLIKGKKIKNILRVGKMIVMELAGNLPSTNLVLGLPRAAKKGKSALAAGERLLTHLKMTGQLIFLNAKGKASGGGHPINFRNFNLAEPNKFTRLILNLKGGGQLLFHDIRKFGWMKIVTAEQYAKIAAAYGVDPLTPQFTLKNFSQIIARRPKMKIKQLLMSQDLIAGIGNIYADESLFAARIKPDRQAGSLQPSEIALLRQKIVAILKAAIKLGGTSVSTFLHSTGERGRFVEKLKVYGRGKKPCLVCGTVLTKTKLAGRGTVFCVHCQQ